MISIPPATLGFSSSPSVVLPWASALTRRLSVPLAKLSEQFYQKFGHDLVEELVSYLNGMDATYRADLRELNELNFARFDAKLEQRVAEVKSEVRQEVEQLRVELRAGLAELRGALHAEVAGLRGEVDAALGRMRGELGGALGRMQGELGDALGRMQGEFGGALGRIQGEFGGALGTMQGEFGAALGRVQGEFRGDLKAQTGVLVKWILGIWLATVPTLAGVIAVVQHFLPAARP